MKPEPFDSDHLTAYLQSYEYKAQKMVWEQNDKQRAIALLSDHGFYYEQFLQALLDDLRFEKSL